MIFMVLGLGDHWVTVKEPLWYQGVMDYLVEYWEPLVGT